MNEIKHQLMNKIGDTSKRVTRIQQQVNLKKTKKTKVKKEQWTYYSIITAFIGVLAFCFFLIPFPLEEGEGNLTEQEQPELVTPTEEENTPVVKKGEYYELLKQYFFEDGSEAVFLGGFENGGETTKTLWLSDHYVQQITSNDGAITEKIYRLNENQVELVYRENIDGLGTSQFTLDELNKLPRIEIILKAPFTIGDKYGKWTVIETSGQLKTTYGDFSNVLIVENQIDNMRMRKYYVQGFGEVKLGTEFLNESGQYKEEMRTELAVINSATDLENAITPSQFNTNTVYDFEPTFHSPWKPSPGGMQQATIEGKGEQAGEEGEAVLVIENLETSESTIYKLKDNEHGQYTPKVVEWIDENRLFVIIGYAHGMVTTGGKLYELDIKENIVTPVIVDLQPREEIMSIKINEDSTFTYQKHIYDNDDYNYDESHIEEATLPIPPSN